MWTFLKGLVLLPVAIVAVLLAVANRQTVLLSFDPFSGASPEFSVALPLFVVVFGAVILGVVIGGIGAWLGQAGHRRARRQSQREINRLRADLDRRPPLNSPTPGGLPALR